MSISPEMKRVAFTAAGAAIVALAAAHLYRPAEQAIKKGLVDNPEQVGKPVKANTDVQASETDEDSFTYDFIMIGGGESFDLSNPPTCADVMIRHCGIGSCIAV
ncbi:hypothetical protein FRC11_012436, partial [Ceratobasidium sp. 423]